MEKASPSTSHKISFLPPSPQKAGYEEHIPNQVPRRVFALIAMVSFPRLQARLGRFALQRRPPAAGVERTVFPRGHQF